MSDVPATVEPIAESPEITEETDPHPIGMQGLDPSARMLFHIQALIRLVTVQIPMAVMIGVGIALLGGGPWVGLGAGAVAAFGFFLLALWYPSLSFDRWGYELREEDLLIQRGVLFRSLTAIPTARVQHVDTRQGPLEQWIGLARVQIYTAAGMGADGIIPGLDLHDAEALRDELVRRHGDDGV
jgi:membrane protein YdbS with pleckstrin-like domain